MICKAKYTTEKITTERRYAKLGYPYLLDFTISVLGVFEGTQWIVKLCHLPQDLSNLFNPTRYIRLLSIQRHTQDDV